MNYHVFTFTRTSTLSGVTRTQEHMATMEQMAMYQSGASVQECFPHLSDEAREFIISGVVAEEWEEAFGNVE